ncbi:MAG: EAL domain-containing protein [Gammaproteobacteria bacterium]|nr:EAL domain-containing protein [Gammaproteobacteria bacterium]
MALHLVWAIAVYLFAVLGLWVSSDYLIEDGLKIQSARWIEEVDSLGTPIYASPKKQKRIQAIERYLKAYPEISFIHFYGPDGKNLLFDHDTRHHRQMEVPTISDYQIAGLATWQEGKRPIIFDRDSVDGVLRVISPVWIKSMSADDIMNYDPNKAMDETIKIIGYIDLGLDKQQYTDKLVKSIFLGSVAVAALIIVSLVVGRRLILNALAPLANLKIPLDRLAEGDTSVQVESTGDEEIAAISRALNATISAVRMRDETLRNMADHDSLTGLVNRSYFARELDRELALSEGQVKPSALLFIDLDQFKYINDTLGHAAGDRLLIQVAEALQGRMRDQDVIARFGGDEFTVLARDVDRKAAEGVAKSILQMLQDIKFVAGEQSLNVYCSVGITMIDSHRFNAHDLLAQADMACHQAKLRGRNRYHIYEIEEDDKNKMAADMSWSQVIREAITQDKFVFCYQPIIGINQESHEYYEVLLRLPRDGELILPGAFLPAAERFGLMLELDRWVVNRALEILAEYFAIGREITFSINISGQMFEDPKFVKTIREKLDSYQLPGSQVVFEITEQTAIRHLSKAKMIIRNIQALGCRFALDDFGAGFSSFSYIKHLPIDYIKIDGTFVENLSEDTVDQTMVRSIVQIARTLKKKTIAEFVQDKRSHKILKELGVDYFQGNLVGRPELELPTPLPGFRTIKDGNT